MDLYSLADVRFKNEKEHKMYRKQIKDKNLSKMEQKWVDTYLKPIIDFMGNNETQMRIFEKLEIVYSGSCRYSSLTPHQKTCYILFGPRINHDSGEGEGHFRAYVPGSGKIFDPYDKHQLYGSNQFCQTYSLMYILGELDDNSSHCYDDYYKNTKMALEFIKRFTHTKKLKKCIDELLRHPNMCFNIPE